MILKKLCLLYSSCLILLGACTSGEEIPVEEDVMEPVKTDVVVEKRAVTPRDEVKEFHLEIIDSTKESKIASFVESYKSLFKVQDVSSKSELNRYNNKLGVVYSFDAIADSLDHPLSLGFFLFNDSLQIKNLKRNWFNSFGDNRREILEGTPMTTVAHEPMEAGFKELELYISYRDCKQPLNDEQKQLLNDFKKYFLAGAKQKLIVDCAENLTWK